MSVLKYFFVNTISFIGVVLFTMIIGIKAALLAEGIIISLSITSAVFIFGFIGLVKQSYLKAK